MADTKLAKVGITLKERWAANISYEPLDFALWRTQDGGDGRGYIAKKSNINVLPTDDTVWIPATEAGQSIYDLAVRYGKFVGTEEEFVQEYYDAIHDAQNAAAGAEATNTEVQEAENLRKSAENARVEAETARETHETARMDAESNRVAAENQRANAEVQRNSQETARQSAENARQTAEQGRQTAEQGRQSAETARENAEHERRADFEALETDMQNAIHQADEATHEASQINNEVKHDEQLRQQAEQGRVEAEQGRVQQESARQTSESARQAAEINRSNAEANRRNAETAREEAESSRRSAEQGRESAESQRAENESTRQSNESSRQSAETARSEAEQARQGAESTRESNEQTRQSQEGARQSAEQTRAQNEQTRQTQEGSRQTAETARANAESARATAENARKTAETGRVNAETARVNAETARVAAETARETQATSDHQRAESDHAIAAEDHATLDEKISHKADIDGSYDSMAVGLAKNLEGRTNVTDSFFKRTTGGDAEVANGTAQLNEVKGKSQVWNQLVQNGNFADGTTGWTPHGAGNGTISANNGELSYTFAQVGNNSYVNAIGSSATVRINGHKYLVWYEIYVPKACKVLSSYFQGANIIDVSAGWNIVYGFVTATSDKSDASKYFGVANAASAGYNVGDIYKIKNCHLYDLTLIFGAGNEPATVEEFDAWLAENIGEQAYYPYNPGAVLNNRMTGVESIGFNLLDPATGKADILGAYSDVYGNYYGITGTHGTLTFTDRFGNTETITPDEDGKFLLEKAGELSVADAGEDCAVFLWWDGTQTEYKPYEKNVGALDVTHIYGKLNGEGEYVRVWPTGMPGIGDIKDSLKVVDGQVVAERKVGEVDLGTLTYSLSSDIFFPAPLDGMSTESDVNGVLCGKYKPRNNRAVKEDKAMYRANGRPFFQDSACADAASFKSSNAGVLLYYELETPRIFTDLIYRDSESFADNTPVTLPVNYKVDNWGIERIAPQNTEEAVVTTKPELTMRYSIDAVEELNTHRDEIDDLYEKNEELDQRKPEKYGEYPDMAVGSAKTLAGNDTKVEDFFFKPIDCADGLAKLNSARGKSLVWNQLMTDDYTGKVSGAGTILDFSTAKQVVVSRDPNGTLPDYAAIHSTNRIPINGAHKYYFKETIIGSKDGNLTVNNVSRALVANTPQTFTFIKVGGNRYDFATRVGAYLSETTDTLTIKDVQIVDLTLLFGAGNEPATVAEFEAMFPLPYYDYNAGEIVSNKAEAIETTGFNLFDSHEALEITFNAYSKYIDYEPVLNTLKRLKKLNLPLYYKVDAAYATTTGINPGRLTLFSNGISKKIISVRTEFTLDDVDLDTINGILLYGSNQGQTVFSDAIINISDAAKNGSYEPYKGVHTLPLNIPTLTGKLNGEGESVVVFPDGLKSVGSVYDEIVGNRAIKRVGKYVFTGEETLQVANWRPADGTFAGLFPYAMLSNFVNYPMANIPNAILVGVDANNYNNIYGTGLGFTLFAGGTNLYSVAIRVASSVASTGAELVAYLAGRTIYYELATPEEYILDAPLPDTFQAYKGGTIKQLPENTSEPVTAPMVMTVTYAIDAVGTLVGLPRNYVSKESLQAMLNAMQSAGIIASYTMTYNENTGKYDFTFVAPSNS